MLPSINENQNDSLNFNHECVGISHNYFQKAPENEINDNAIKNENDTSFSSFIGKSIDKTINESCTINSSINVSLKINESSTLNSTPLKMIL